MNHTLSSRLGVGILLLLSTVGLGCQSTRDRAYYGTMEKFGVHKREILVDRVDEARESQQEAKEEFQDALEAFMSVVSVDASNLEKLYGRLNSQLKDVEKRASKVDERILAVERVADALFGEWEAELEQYTNNRLRRQSEQTLKRTQNQYQDLVAAMRRAEEKMHPVLQAFQDQVLFLKHNLNAMAIASIQKEVDAIEEDVAELITEMEKAIAEAEAFIAQMRS